MLVKYIGKKPTVSTRFLDSSVVFEAPGAIVDVPDEVGQEMLRTNPGCFTEHVAEPEEFEVPEAASKPAKKAK